MKATTTENGNTAVDAIRIRGARTHNLKNIDVDIPRNQFVVLTGPSGSGKSSLAFDTIYAEGQRQYIESLSVYARQFLHQLERPDVDLIEGLQPTICIDQRPGSQNPRSTVATVTEIYDYLRILMARLGEPRCYACGEAIRQQSPQQIQELILDLPVETKMMILAPIIRGRRGRHEEVMQLIRKGGFVRARIDGDVYDIESLPELDPRKTHHIDAVIDRVVIRSGISTRIAESVNLALRYGDGLLTTLYLAPGKTTWDERLHSSLYACPNCDISYEEIEPRTFSFNSPYGACPGCDGLGVTIEFDPDLITLDPELSLEKGVVVPWKNLGLASLKRVKLEFTEFMNSKKFDWNTPFSELSSSTLSKLFYGDGRKFIGLVNMLEKELATTTSEKRKQELEAFRGVVTCSDCRGSRLRPEANSVQIAGKPIHEISGLSIAEAREFFDSLEFGEQEKLVSTPLVTEIAKRLEFLDKVGVNYLTLDRAADTLSGGELQRVRLASSIGSGLIGVCYVLDEPSIGLHSRDNQRLIDALRDLQYLGNTVVVVEHDESMMRQADLLIDIGPYAGKRGGEVVRTGTPQEFIAHSNDDGSATESLTAKYLSGEMKIEVPKKRRRVSKKRSIQIEAASTNNLLDVSTYFPLGALVCITGVSGSGKSSLINETLARAIHRRLGNVAPKPGPHRSLRGVSQIDKLIEIDQSPIGRTPRSNPATYTGAFDEIRKVFAGTREAKQRGYKANRFSFNVKSGRCEACQGQGLQKIEMNFLPDLYVTCSECNGARFNRQTLQVVYRGKSIADVLAMSIDESVEFFENFANIHRLLKS
ncbi:MAG: excinuclease ABC subunit A, partial [Pirellulaceae bacterium]